MKRNDYDFMKGTNTNNGVISVLSYSLFQFSGICGDTSRSEMCANVVMIIGWCSIKNSLL